MINNYRNIANNFYEEGQILKALKFYDKAYKCEGGNKDIDLLLDILFEYAKKNEELESLRNLKAYKAMFEN
jgi:hypothetical protein